MRRRDEEGVGEEGGGKTWRGGGESDDGERKDKARRMSGVNL